MVYLLTGTTAQLATLTMQARAAKALVKEANEFTALASEESVHVAV